MTNKKRFLTCTFCALASGFFGALISGQTTLLLHQQKCQNQPIIFKQICTAAVTPGAMWQGVSTGIWTGTILGAFAAGIATRN